jgi:hypothetical protein
VLCCTLLRSPDLRSGSKLRIFEQLLVLRRVRSVVQQRLRGSEVAHTGHHPTNNRVELNVSLMLHCSDTGRLLLGVLNDEAVPFEWLPIPYYLI